jgi:uncharacterized protein YegL
MKNEENIMMANRMYSKNGNLSEVRETIGKQTYIGMALDRSGSMGHLVDSTVSGFNEWLETIRTDAKKGGNTSVTLFTFGGNDVKCEFSLLDPQKIRPLSRGVYKPKGNTPMYDGIGRLLDELEEYDIEDTDTGFLVIIISDGYENASRIWNRNSIAARINNLKATGRWTFAYVGANQDVFEVQKDLGIKNVLPWEFTLRGTEHVYNVASASTSRYFDDRAAGATCSNTFFKDTTTGGKE